MKIMKSKIFLLVFSSLLIAPMAYGIDYPTKQLNFTIPFGPGGGNDRMVRTLVKILNKYDMVGGQNIVAENIEGGSGAVGWNYVVRQKRNPYHITSTSGNFLATPIVSNTGWTYKNFTPVALLAQDAMFLAVRSDSNFKTLEDFVAHAKKNRVLISGIGVSGPDRVVAGLFAKASGINMVFVPVQDEGGMITSLTSKSVDAVVSNPSEVAGQMEAGNFRALAYSEAQRSAIYPDIPTFKEKGYDFSFSLPRGVVLPPGNSDEVVDWWVGTLKKVVETPEWKDYLNKNSLSGNTIWGKAFGKYLESTDAQFRGVLTEIGVLKK